MTFPSRRDPSRRSSAPARFRRRTVVHACHHDHGPAVDSLTGLAARDVLEALLGHDPLRARAGDTGPRPPVACLLVDVVGLKQTHALHGFTAGDALLRRAAERLRSLAPDARLLSRLGGDELVAVFIGSDAAAQATRATTAAAAADSPPLRSAWGMLGDGEPATALFDRLYAEARRGG